MLIKQMYQLISLGFFVTYFTSTVFASDINNVNGLTKKVDETPLHIKINEQQLNAETINPIIAGTLDTSYATGVSVVGNYAYVTDREYGIKIVDITNPITPVLVGSVDTDSAYGVAISGHYAYVADCDGGLKIVNVENPTAPTVVGNLDLGTGDCALDIKVVGRYAYIADGNAGLKIVDIVNPAAPVLIGSLSIGGSCSGIEVIGMFAYLACGSAGLKIVNITNPATPVLIGSLGTFFATNIQIGKNYAYISAGDEGVKIIDITVLSAPVLVGSIDLGRFAEDIAISGDYAYVTAGSGNEGGFKLVSILDPANPILINSLVTDDGCTTCGARGISVSGSYAFVADGTPGLKIIQKGPIISEITKTISTNTALEFNSADFVSKDGINLTKIKIVSLPSYGTLKFQESEVTLNQELPISSINSLKFVPNTDWNGNTSFRWQGSDGKIYSINTTNTNIEVKKANNASANDDNLGYCERHPGVCYVLPGLGGSIGAIAAIGGIVVPIVLHMHKNKSGCFRK